MSGHDSQGSSFAGQAGFDSRRLLELVRLRHRIPASTYRVQLSARFTFRDAAAIVPYLARLGVGACYCSPYLQARPGTEHGYDICDHSRLDEELGTEDDYASFTGALAEHEMGQVLDFVPNHMGLDPVANPWWRDVLENGPSSAYASFFDIDWSPIKPELRGKVLLPVLEDQYGVVLERGDLQLAWIEGRLVVRRGMQHFPVDPKEYPRVLRYRLDSLERALGPENPHVRTLRRLVEGFHELPGPDDTGRAQERRVRKESLLRGLSELMAISAEVTRHLEQNLAHFNGRPGRPESFDLLHELLEAQPYRLAYWQAAHDEINYRRFFQINDLGGLRMEDPEVFAASHVLVLRLIREGTLTGLRLDHLDGLFDPLAYLNRLQEAVLMEWAAECFSVNSSQDEALRQFVRGWRRDQRSTEPGGLADRPLYLVAEKILGFDESLPTTWPLHGTTGYDFLNHLNGLFVDRRHHGRMRRIHEEFSGRAHSFEEEVYECKKLITRISMASNLKTLARELDRITERNRRTRDFTVDILREAIRELVACFPVYRTHVDASGIRPADHRVIEQALRESRRRNPMMMPMIFEFLRRVLVGDEIDISAEERRRRLNFVMKFQQYTGPVEAKGVEDTAFYRHNVLVSLNEVGGEPRRFGCEPEEFHQANVRRLRDWPATLLATATHDTKRGEDVRARLNVLSEIPEDWDRHIRCWRSLHETHRTDLDGQSCPDPNVEYLLYQTLVGAWPADPSLTPSDSVPEPFLDRIRGFVLKAAREAKIHTSWRHPMEGYERALSEFVERVLQGPTTRRFLEDFLPFQQRIAHWGMINSLAQVLLKIVSPGVPDFYQGAELWDLNLVDPDNRRLVDYARRRRLLEDLEPFLLGSRKGGGNPVAVLGELLENWPDGRIKLFVTACGLRLRGRLPELFLKGEYVPLRVTGAFSQHVVAAARCWKGRWAAAVVPRLVARLVPTERSLPLGSRTWGDTEVALPAEISGVLVRNLLTGESVELRLRDDGSALRMADVFRICPAAFLLWEKT